MSRALSLCLTLISALALSACEGPAQRLQGAWVIDLSMMRQEALVRRAAPPAGPFAQELREAAYRDWRIVFKADESMEASLRGQRYQGRYVISQILSSTIYLRIEGASVSQSELDERLGLKGLERAPLSERVTIKLQGKGRATLSFDQGLPLPIRRLRVGI